MIGMDLQTHPGGNGVKAYGIEEKAGYRYEGYPAC